MSCHQVLSSGRKKKSLLLLLVFVISLCLPSFVLARSPNMTNDPHPPPAAPSGDPIGGNKGPLGNHEGDTHYSMSREDQFLGKSVVEPSVPQVSTSLAVPCLGFIKDVAQLISQWVTKIKQPVAEKEKRSLAKGP